MRESISSLFLNESCYKDDVLIYFSLGFLREAMMGDPVGIFWINKLHKSLMAVSSVEHIKLHHLVCHQMLSGMLKTICSKLLANILVPQ